MSGLGTRFWCIHVEPSTFSTVTKEVRYIQIWWWLLCWFISIHIWWMKLLLCCNIPPGEQAKSVHHPNNPCQEFCTHAQQSWFMRPIACCKTSRCWFLQEQCWTSSRCRCAHGSAHHQSSHESEIRSTPPKLEVWICGTSIEWIHDD